MRRHLTDVHPSTPVRQSPLRCLRMLRLRAGPVCPHLLRGASCRPTGACPPCDRNSHYRGHLQVHTSLLNLVLHGHPQVAADRALERRRSQFVFCRYCTFRDKVVWRTAPQSFPETAQVPPGDERSHLWLGVRATRGTAGLRPPLNAGRTSAAPIRRAAGPLPRLARYLAHATRT
jgi:hypothetical protein